MPQKPPAQPPRHPAPHVQASVARAAQAKLPDRTLPSHLPQRPVPVSRNPPQTVHVSRALAPAQAKLPERAPQTRPPATHVQHVVAAVQKRSSALSSGPRQPAPHVQATLAQGIQAKPREGRQIHAVVQKSPFRFRGRTLQTTHYAPQGDSEDAPEALHDILADMMVDEDVKGIDSLKEALEADLAGFGPAKAWVAKHRADLDPLLKQIVMVKSVFNPFPQMSQTKVDGTPVQINQSILNSLIVESGYSLLAGSSLSQLDMFKVYAGEGIDLHITVEPAGDKVHAQAVEFTTRGTGKNDKVGWWYQLVKTATDYKFSFKQCNEKTDPRKLWAKVISNEAEDHFDSGTKLTVLAEKINREIRKGKLRQESKSGVARLAKNS